MVDILYMIIGICNPNERYEKRLNNDAYQFHQYKQNEQSPLSFSLHKKKTQKNLRHCTNVYLYKIFTKKIKLSYKPLD